MSSTGSPPRGFEIIGYHCSHDEEEMKSILKFGYRVTPPSPIYFDAFLYQFSATLPSTDQARLDRIQKKLNLAYQEGAERTAMKLRDDAAEAVQRMWTKRFPGGLVWIGPYTVSSTYGSYCVKITLPTKARLIIEDEYGGKGYYVEKDIPPSRIRPA